MEIGQAGDGKSDRQKGGKNIQWIKEHIDEFPSSLFSVFTETLQKRVTLNVFCSLPFSIRHYEHISLSIKILTKHLHLNGTVGTIFPSHFSKTGVSLPLSHPLLLYLLFPFPLSFLLSLSLTY